MFVCDGHRSLPKTFTQAQPVAVRVGHDELVLAKLPLPTAIPAFLGLQEQGHASLVEAVKDGAARRDLDLEVEAAPNRGARAARCQSHGLCQPSRS